jgi:hypothetical protein
MKNRKPTDTNKKKGIRTKGVDVSCLKPLFGVVRPIYNIFKPYK